MNRIQENRILPFPFLYILKNENACHSDDYGRKQITYRLSKVHYYIIPYIFCWIINLKHSLMIFTLIFCAILPTYGRRMSPSNIYHQTDNKKVFSPSTFFLLQLLPILPQLPVPLLSLLH